MTQNPIKEARESLGLSQTDLANLSCVSRRYIIQLEQLIPESPPLDVLIILTQGDHPEALARAYARAYREKVQPVLDAVQRSPNRVQWDDINYTIPFLKVNAHMWLRRSACRAFNLPTSQIKYCTFTKVRPSVLQSYEALSDGSNTGMPKQLVAALKLFDAPDRTIMLVENKIAGWKELKLV